MMFAIIIYILAFIGFYIVMADEWQPKNFKNYFLLAILTLLWPLCVLIISFIWLLEKIFGGIFDQVF